MNMKASILTVALLGFLIGPSYRAVALDPALARFCRAKQQQVQDLARTTTNKVPGVVWSFFDALRVDDWETATNLADRIRMASQRYAQATNDVAISPALATLIWPPLAESDGAYAEFHEWNSKWLHRFGREIIDSIPHGSVYFGGTDPGRFIISVLVDSQVEAKPFFILTQNQLADEAYLDYLRTMYGEKISIPGTNETRQVFQDYLNDASERLKLGKLKPGEDVRIVNDRAVVSGVVAVMEINGLLAKRTFEDNPAKEFFLEESYVLEWMYPYLEPHGLIFQILHKPRESFGEIEIEKEQTYWKKLADEMVGSWLQTNTSIKAVCDFAHKYGSGKNLGDYPGDKTFAANSAARKTFSKLLAAIAGLYIWRMEHSADSDDRDRMYRAADLALRQGYAMCPSLPESVFRYANLLLSRRRPDDAILIAKTSLSLNPDDQQLQNLVSRLVQQY
jgi:hypothetical protein